MRYNGTTRPTHRDRKSCSMHIETDGGDLLTKRRQYLSHLTNTPVLMISLSYPGPWNPDQCACAAPEMVQISSTCQSGLLNGPRFPRFSLLSSHPPYPGFSQCRLYFGLTHSSAPMTCREPAEVSCCAANRVPLSRILPPGVHTVRFNTKPPPY
jgi:hypothetical protein